MFKDYFKLLHSLMMPYNDKNNMIFPWQLLLILGYNITSWKEQLVLVMKARNTV